MPSYRVAVTIGVLRPGAQPQAVLPAAVHAARELTTVEASDVGIVRGMPRLIIRFTGDSPGFARQVATCVTAAVNAMAEPLVTTVTERVKGRWLVVR